MPVRAVPERGGNGVFEAHLSQASQGSFFPASGWYRPQIPAVSLNVLRFFSASRASIAVASVVNARDARG